MPVYIFAEIYAIFLSKANIMKFMHEFNISFKDAIEERDVLFVPYLITKYHFEYTVLCKLYVMSQNAALQFAVLANTGS